MSRTFNTTGPCDEQRHYMLPPEARLPDLGPWADEQLYFVLHAARQTGKTTAMRAFTARMRAQGYVAVWATLETSQGFTDVADAEPTWLQALVTAADLSLPEAERPPAPEFLDWWRENAAILEERAERDYLEAVPHIVFMAFLQRVVNGGGRITREYAAGRGALDLLVEYAGEKHVFELKRVPPRHVALERVRAQGLAQLAGYLDTVGVREGWLLIFDQRPGRTWEERLTAEDVNVDGKLLRVRGA